MTADLLCAACIASANGDRSHAAWTSRWSITIYRGNALCMEHFEEIRKVDAVKAAQKATSK